MTVARAGPFVLGDGHPEYVARLHEERVTGAAQVLEGERIGLAHRAAVAEEEHRPRVWAIREQPVRAQRVGGRRDRSYESAVVRHEQKLARSRIAERGAHRCAVLRYDAHEYRSRQLIFDLESWNASERRSLAVASAHKLAANVRQTRSQTLARTKVERRIEVAATDA